MEAGRWGTRAGIDRARNLANRFAGDGIVVEANGPQAAWAQLLAREGARR